VDLYVSREPGADARVIASDPVAIVVGMSFGALPIPVQDFLLGRAVLRAITGFPPATRSEHEVRADLWTAAAALDFTDPPMGSDPKRIRAIAKAVTRKQRKDVSEPLQAWVARPQSFDVAAFVLGARRSADRAGLLACIDVDRAAEAMALVEPDVSAAKADGSNVDPFWSRAARLPVLRDLLVFAVSEELFTLRRKTGCRSCEDARAFFRGGPGLRAGPRHTISDPRVIVLVPNPDQLEIRLNDMTQPGDESVSLRRRFDGNRDGKLDDAEASLLESFLVTRATLNLKLWQDGKSIPLKNRSARSAARMSISPPALRSP